LITRVFKLKKQQMLDEVFQDGIFGKYPARSASGPTRGNGTGSRSFSPARGSNQPKRPTPPGGGGARHAEVEGIPESQIRRAGRWGRSAMEVYLEGFPRVFMRKMAGFPEEAASTSPG
jgi:hypothetical protein